jgi:hypothetical protein
MEYDSTLILNNNILLEMRVIWHNNFKKSDYNNFFEYGLKYFILGGMRGESNRYRIIIKILLIKKLLSYYKKTSYEFK